MARTTFWKIWTRTNSEEKALKVLNRLLNSMGRTAQVISVDPHLEPEAKLNGHIVRFSIALESENWNDQIIECFCIGQRVAYGWGLMGNVIDDPGGCSSTVSDSGVAGIEWSFR